MRRKGAWSTSPQGTARFPLEGAGAGDEQATRADRHSVINEPNTRPPALADSSLVPPTNIGRAMLMYSENEGHPQDEHVMNVQWTDVDIDVVLDSGCSDHVMNVELDAPG